ncbi:MAG TPA: hypothetical protein VL326_03640 [Kofleriaceae bacterium]|nr:hypothetical protein [Kofleriaceae bacterium]
MRTTTLALVSLLTACVAPIGDRTHDDFGPDAGVDGSSATGACDNLKTVTMNLTVSGTANYTGLPSTCWKLNGKLTITGPAVSSVEKLGDLREVTDLEINDADISAFNTKNPVEVGGDIYIHNNDKLTDISKVVAKSTIKSLRVDFNPLLTNLGGANKATIVSGLTSITNNVKLGSVDLSSAQRLEGGVAISDNGALTTIQLTTLQSVGSFSVERNPLLTTLSNMSSMTQVHGAFTINDNDSLVSLGQFGTGITFSSTIVVSNNLKLADVGALQYAGSVLGSMAFNNNSALDYTRAHDVACCVPGTGLFSASGNKTSQCAGNHYCLNTQQQCNR